MRTHPGRARIAMTAATLMVAAACADTATAPATPPALDVDAAESSVAREEGTFISNARKYADAGQRPATGRAGSALAAMQALLAKDGSAVVEVVVGEEWTGWTRDRTMHDDPYGDATIAKAQLKGFDPAGELQFTRNFQNVDRRSASLPANGLLRGGRAQVQVNVRDADPTRTGVVTVDAPVLLRPDIAIVGLQRPPRAVRNTAIPIVAVLRELNGDVGAWADCVLYVNGVEADRVHGLWVDAGGTVTCAMMHMFRTVGESALEVRVERVAPGDYDPANNSAASRIPVIFVRSDFHFDAHVRDATFSEKSQQESSWRAASGLAGGEWSWSREASGRTQQSHMSAYIPRAMSFPLGELFARQYTRDETAHQVLFRALPADWTWESPYDRQTCVSRSYNQPATGRGWVSVCSYELLTPEGPVAGYTTVNYDRYAGDVTYASREHSHFWNRDLGIDDVYSWNSEGRDLAGRFTRYGAEWAFFIRLIDRGVTYTANPFVGMLPFEVNHSSPRSCSGWEDSWGTSRYCSEMSVRATGMEGFVYGEPSG